MNRKKELFYNYFLILSTFRYFLYGKKDFAYNGGRTSDAFIKFMEDPKEQEEEPEEQEPEWKDTPSGVVHLEDDDFDDFLKSHDSMLVMFYAPCKLHVSLYSFFCQLVFFVFFRAEVFSFK